MRNYESIVVFSPKLSDADLASEIEKAKSFLNGKGAKDLTLNTWGRRELAYEVKKGRYGVYVQYSYGASNKELPNELAAYLNLIDTCVLYQSHRIPEGQRKFQGNPKSTGEFSFDDDDSNDSRY